MRAEDHRLFRQLCHRPQTERLKTAAVRQDRPLPTHELVKPCRRLDDLYTRPEIEVIGVSKNDVRSQLSKLLGRHPLHTAQGWQRA